MTTVDLTYVLPAVAKIEDCEELYAFLSTSQDQAVEIDCSAVTRLSGLSAQLLTMAQKAASNGGTGLVLANPSAGFLNGAKMLGLQDILQTEGATV